MGPHAPLRPVWAPSSSQLRRAGALFPFTNEKLEAQRKGWALQVHSSFQKILELLRDVIYCQLPPHRHRPRPLTPGLHGIGGSSSKVTLSVGTASSTFTEIPQPRGRLWTSSCVTPDPQGLPSRVSPGRAGWLHTHPQSASAVLVSLQACVLGTTKHFSSLPCPASRGGLSKDLTL